MATPVYEPSDTDACRVAVANLEFCLACHRYDLAQCRAAADTVERCCKRFWVRARAWPGGCSRWTRTSLAGEVSVWAANVELQCRACRALAAWAQEA